MKFRRHGYSFPEVLFAVVVLGIGFIMIAAIFPVAIAQSKQTLDETAAAAISRGAVNALSKIGDDQHYAVQGQGINAALMLPPTGTTGIPQVQDYTLGEVKPFDTQNGWNAIAKNQIFAQDPRYAFVPLYRRDGDPRGTPAVQPASFAQVFAIVVQCKSVIEPRLSLEFGPASGTGTDVDMKLTQASTPIQNPNNLYPRQIKINNLTDNYKQTGVDVIELDSKRDTNSAATENLPDALAEGAYVVMRRPTTVFGNPTPRFYNYRVGTPRPDIATCTAADGTLYPAAWELMPGNDMLDSKENITNGNNIYAWCVGRERLANGVFIGAAQDISMFTIYIKVNP